MHSVHGRVDPCLDESSKHCTGETAGREDATALSKLSLCIPGTQNIVCSHKGARLCKAEEEADCHDALGIGHRGRDHCEPSPENHHRREEQARTEVGQGKIGRDLTDNVSHREDGVDLVEFIPLEVQLFAHSRHVGIVDIRTIEIISKVAQTAERQNEEIELAQQFGLAGHALRAPDIGGESGKHSGNQNLG